MMYALIFLGVCVVGNSAIHYVLHRIEKNKADALPRVLRDFDDVSPNCMKCATF
jgi:hypothetical protein